VRPHHHHEATDELEIVAVQGFLGAEPLVIALPPKCPELNPVENVWQFMRDNWLSNRIFKSYDDLVDHCCEAWNKLVDQPWRIMSIGLRQWAHGF
jgi:transposase